MRAAFCRDARSTDEPALIVLYGCGGYGGLDRRLAEEFPRAGYATLYVDYFGLTPPPDRRGFCSPRSIAPRVLAIWQEVVLSAAAALRHARGVDARRVGVLGWSMGADVALSVAAAGSRQLSVVVAYSPATFPPLAARASAFPPTLLLLSARGDVHALRGARAFVDALTAARVAAELFVYPAGSHYWQRRQGEEGFRHALAFLDRYLR